MKKSLTDAVHRIKDAGFGYIKLELEAQLNRGQTVPCTTCDRSGRVDCTACRGEGILDNNRDCSSCSGDGRILCAQCRGQGSSSNEYGNTNACGRFINNYVSTEARQRLIYGRFYNDGSVDSEYTYTMAIENVEYMLEYMNAFKALAKAINNRFDTSGAGMHISLLLEDTDGDYPSHIELDDDGIDNFTNQVTKLLPALFFLASANYQSRSLGFRMPQISDEEKYSAIYTHENTCLEYRVFETCYDKPETLYDFVEVIANTVKYYADPSLEAKSLGKEFTFRGKGRHIARFYNTPDQLRVLNAQIKELKPKDKTIKALKAERSVNYTIKALLRTEKVRVHELRDDYRKLKQTAKEVEKRPLTQRELNLIEEEMNYSGMSRDEATRRIRGVRELPTMREFIRANLRNGIQTAATITV